MLNAECTELRSIKLSLKTLLVWFKLVFAQTLITKAELILEREEEMSAGSFLDGFVHEDLSGNVIRQTRARILAGIGIFFWFVMITNASRGFMGGDPFSGVVVGLCGFLMLGTVFLVKYTGYVYLSCNLFVGIYTFIVAFATYRDGGAVSHIPYNYAVLVITGYLLCGRKAGTIWLILAIGISSVYKTLADSGFDFPPQQEDSAFLNLLVIVSVTGLMAFIYEYSSLNNLKNFSSEKAKSDKSAKELQALFLEVEKVMENVSKGDLSRQINVNLNENLENVKASINSAIKMLSQTINQVLGAAEQIDSGTSQLSSAAQSLAGGATEQAAGLEEISSSMDEIGAKAKTNSESAQQAQSLTRVTSNEIDSGNKQMEAMLDSMNKIKSTSDNVSKVIKVIDEIAFQTNLLALNAAVEAARAGKYGKGFAVVAEEVRNLASRSAEAAKDTTELIETSLAEVENGVKNADQTAEILKGFVDSINKVTDFVGEISAASQEQAKGAVEVNNGLSQLNNVVQQNSSISEQTASASQELSTQADFLMNLMKNFTLNGEAGLTLPGGAPIAPREAEPDGIKHPQVTAKVNTRQIPLESGTKRKIVLDDGDFGKY